MQILDVPVMTESYCLMRADRISRNGNRWLGRLKLDLPTLEQVSKSRIGLFAEGFVGLDTMIGRILPVASNPWGALTVVLYASKEAGDFAYEQLAGSGYCMACHSPPERWRVGNLVFSSVEGLNRLDCPRDSISNLILLDPTCMVHRARTLKTSNGRTHDRPQIIADFIADQASNWAVLTFMLMTTKRAAAVPTDAIARAYCLETFWFLDGPSITCR